MNKFTLSAAIAAALVSVSAQAAFPLTAGLASDTTVLYIAGASAQRTFIENLFTKSGSLTAADAICDTSEAIYTFKDNGSGTDQNAYYCKTNQSNTHFDVATVGSHILVYKRSAGGSDYGVAYVINQDPTVQYLKVDDSVCGSNIAGAAGTVVTTTCTYSATDATKNSTSNVQLGVSDVDPIQFVGRNATAGIPDVTVDQVGNLTVSPAATVVFGEQVSENLYRALQAAQQSTGQIAGTCALGDRSEACMPTLSKGDISSIHAGKWKNWNNLIVGATGLGLYDWVNTNSNATIKALAPAVNSVNICRRVRGSGTQTQHGINFLNYPCSSAANATLPFETTAGNGETVSAQTFLMSTSGDVNKCLQGLDLNTSPAPFTNPYPVTGTGAGKRWAVGLNSLEQKDGSTVANPSGATGNWGFVKINGVAPTLTHVVEGTYFDWAENTFQYDNTTYGNLNGDQQSLIDAIMTEAAQPSLIATQNGTFTHGFGNGAYLTAPNATYLPTTTQYLSTSPINVWTHSNGNAGLNNCQVPVSYKAVNLN